MSLSVDHSVEFFSDLGDLGVQVVMLVRDIKNPFKVIGALAPLAEKAKELIVGAKSSLPELQDLTADEAFAVCRAAFGAVEKIVKAV